MNIKIRQTIGSCSNYDFFDTRQQFHFYSEDDWATAPPLKDFLLAYLNYPSNLVDGFRNGLYTCLKSNLRNIKRGST